ncbi:cytochrome b5 domain-containing protein [Marinisporobacter balticus]|uniref:Putative heme/steroid binding protein n=1 Tax=Marinisporobacter balticus TaxID=2018667 RepID=A0A4R2KPF0_9FIRM|nr:cytochrome b5 domain-containing protein [Marinisporobacter balticus]TCO74632.1 putative heme/steroid binding protein [Marinisporobacter balticus]
MNKNEDIAFAIQESIRKINYLKRIKLFALYSYQKFYYGELLKYEESKLRNLTSAFNNNHRTQLKHGNPKQFTIEELAKYDGSNGKPAYIAVNGIVYDVSTESTWGGGTHFGLYAGKDLTDAFNRCHNNEEILKNLPKVGVLKK